MTKKVNWSMIFISIAAIILFAFLAYLFPYSGDDWDWGSKIGIERLNSWFKDYNGRYCGNLVVIALTRIPLLKIICMATSYYLTGLLVYRFSGSKRILIFLFSITLFFAMPKEIFVQAVVWTSGYSNYVPPILMMIGYMVIIKNIFDKDIPVYNKALPAVTLLIGFLGSLFMENLTLYSIAIAILVIIYCAIKYKKLFAAHIAYFAGAVGGAVMMFSNSAYGLIASNNDEYRSFAMNDSNLVVTLGSHIKAIYEQLFTRNFIILGIATILAVGLCIAKTHELENQHIKRLSKISAVINLLTYIVLVLKGFLPNWDIMHTSNYSVIVTVLFFAAIAGCYYISLSLIMILLLKEHGTKGKAIFLIVSLPIMVAPLLVVSPIGPRCFFPPFMILCMMVVLMLDELLCSQKKLPSTPPQKNSTDYGTFNMCNFHRRLFILRQHLYAGSQI